MRVGFVCDTGEVQWQAWNDGPALAVSSRHAEAKKARSTPFEAWSQRRRHELSPLILARTPGRICAPDDIGVSVAEVDGIYCVNISTREGLRLGLVWQPILAWLSERERVSLKELELARPGTLSLVKDPGEAIVALWHSPTAGGTVKPN